MATIKKGTYRFKDILDISDIENLMFAEPIEFKSNGVLWTGMAFFTTSFGFQLGYAAPENEGIFPYDNGIWTDEAYKTVEVTKDYEASFEGFSTFFEKNTEPIEPMSYTIKAGTYRFNDILKISELGVIFFADPIKFKTNGVSCIGMSTLVIEGVGDYLSYFTSKTESINVYADGVWEDEAYKIIEVTEDYENPSADFATFFAENAEPVLGTTITYNGKTIASLMAGQTATLKCKGDNVKMLSDIVVKAADNVGGSNANIVPLVVSANGTYNNPTLPIVETWGTDTIFDLSLDYNGVTVGIKKVGSIPFPDDVSALMVKGNTLTLTIADAETKEVHSVQTFPFDDYAENIIDLDGTGAVIIDELGILCFVKDASIANKTFGVTWFEDNTVYVSNAVDLSLDDEYWYECKLYLQEGNVSADGYNPVVVDVPIPEGYVLPNGDYSIDRNGTYNITYYSNVIVNTPTIYFVKSTADLPVNAANGSIAYVLGGT